MELFLMVLCVSVLGIGLSGLAFAAATNDVREMETAPEPRVVEAPAVGTRFFADDVVAATTARVTPTRVPPVTAEALLLQIERHVRLELAAAEAFLEVPTPQSLHSRTMSPLVH